MRNRFYLLTLKVSGIKNIEKDIQIDFYKKTIDKNFNPEKYRVKAIYGENGSGKTAIVTAVHLLKQLMSSEAYLSESKNQQFLHEIINKKTERLNIEVEFRVDGVNDNRVYKYQIELSKTKSDKYVISSESLWVKSGNYAAAQYKAVYVCENGGITRTIDASFEEELRRVTANLLNTRSMLCSVIGRSDERFEQELIEGFAVPVIETMYFALCLRARIEESDQHDLYFMQQVAYNTDDPEQIMNEVLPQMLDILNDRQRHSDLLVYKTDFDRYKKMIKQMELFIKCFKSDLKGIEIDKKDNKEFYDCRLLMIYDGHKVDVEFESTGIKKLMQLFDYIHFSAQGGIVFIDEMDSNINDVYLCKLIEYFMRYGKGQLCFTTHNTSPMSVLREGKNSIDFLSNDGQVITWKRNGNFSPESLYRNGMIEYLPFNIEAENFIGILGE